MAEGIALTAGTFDPVTVGHMDIITRASKMYDFLVVGIFENPDKTPMFPLETRFAALCAATMELSNVLVVTNDGMLCDYAKEIGACAIVKGVRNEQDREYEKLQADYNFEHSGIKTVLLECSPQYKDVSSSLVRRLITENKDCGKYLPAGAEEIIFG